MSFGAGCFISADIEKGKWGANTFAVKDLLRSAPMDKAIHFSSPSRFGWLCPPYPGI
jgi:hypothetical protein